MANRAKLFHRHSMTAGLGHSSSSAYQYPTVPDHHVATSKTCLVTNKAFGGVYCGPASDILNPPTPPPKPHHHHHFDFDRTVSVFRTSSLRKSFRSSIRRKTDQARRVVLSARNSRDPNSQLPNVSSAPDRPGTSGESTDILKSSVKVTHSDPTPTSSPVHGVKPRHSPLVRAATHAERKRREREEEELASRQSDVSQPLHVEVDAEENKEVIEALIVVDTVSDADAIEPKPDVKPEADQSCKGAAKPPPDHLHLRLNEPLGDIAETSADQSRKVSSYLYDTEVYQEITVTSSNDHPSTSGIKDLPDVEKEDETAKTQKESLTRRLSKGSKKILNRIKGKTKCEICKKKCSGDILKAGDKFFHIACFQCKTCRRNLSEVGFFEHVGAYFCPADYHAQFGKKCPQCLQFAEGNVVECMGDTYHQRCFKCTRCCKPFPTGEKVTYNGVERLCLRCVTVPVAIVKPQEHTTQYQASEQDLTKPITAQTLAPGGPTVCQACSQMIHTGQILLALEAQWHIWCFKCTACQSVLHGEYMAKDTHPYCIRDYNAEFGVRCCECDRYIAGKVLQAGQYKFHPLCASCTRCGNTFNDGEEMFMQGNEIWHAKCNNMKPTDPQHMTQRPHSPHATANIVTSIEDPLNPQNKYPVNFGKLLTYMYLLPEPELGYLRHQIEPHPVPPEQFHVPKGPVKIRKSRISMLKTGMQRLTELMDDDEAHPRAKSPHMDNEEPIEMAHYPGGMAHDSAWVPPIERDDFPAPAFPYAVEALKRRLSTSSIEDNDDDDAEDMADNAVRIAKIEIATAEMKKFENESSIAHAIATDLEEQSKKAKQPLHWDPRSASRTANAKKLPSLRCRYDTPVNASPSRYINRPRPWQYCKDGGSTTATLNYHQLYPSQTNTAYSMLIQKSSTLPANQGQMGKHTSLGGFYDEMYGEQSAYTMNSLMAAQGGATLPAGGSATARGIDVTRFQPKHAPVPSQAILRNSLPDMSKPNRIYPYEQLTTNNKTLPDDADRGHLERHLTQEEFEKLFDMTPIEFYKLPEWKRINLKRKAKLF